MLPPNGPDTPSEGWPFLYDSQPQVEPSADLRDFAQQVRQVYLSFTGAGFTPVEALELTKTVITRGQSND